jgi:hypothetical protein
LDFTAIGGKRQGREVPQSLRVEPGAKHPGLENPINRNWTFCISNQYSIIPMFQYCGIRIDEKDL